MGDTEAIAGCQASATCNKRSENKIKCIGGCIVHTDAQICTHELRGRPRGGWLTATVVNHIKTAKNELEKLSLQQ